MANLFDPNAQRKPKTATGTNTDPNVNGLPITGPPTGVFNEPGPDRNPVQPGGPVNVGPEQPIVDRLPMQPGGPTNLFRDGLSTQPIPPQQPGVNVFPEDGGMRPPDLSPPGGSGFREINPNGPQIGGGEVIDRPQMAGVDPMPKPQTPPPPAGQPFEEMGNGLVKFGDGTVVPKDHPLFAQKTGPGATGTAIGGAGAQAPPQTVQGAFQKALLSKLGSDPNNVSTSSPELRGAVDANRLAQQRSSERQRQAARERQVAQGITGGGAETEMTGIEQNRGAQEAAFEGNLVAKAASDRRNELTQYMAMAGNQLSQQEQLAAQKELAHLDAEIRRAGIAQQGALGGRDLDLRDKLGTWNLNLGLLGLLQNNDQFGKSLGFQSGLAGAQLNQQALLSLLGGLS